jgi:hypothetical protein
MKGAETKSWMSVTSTLQPSHPALIRNWSGSKLASFLIRLRLAAAGRNGMITKKRLGKVC